ncbi:MAG: hypothetical protein GWN67_24905 [Phycisphaerae bacterium]|nr:hypothetical protein [Phycisphaerae bacterium]NIP55362.1 hypothetical protein [Phycisphaerae bacterium]NIS54131.1 hypothetical protein [Phycisphaerae bacterium]NIU11683.1 hypothetical protein [Phycisphaerae bacterium]NIU59505.1 hypothetical protein [Phycisphaerae bacterium]
MLFKNTDGSTILRFLPKTFFLLLVINSGLSGMQAAGSDSLAKSALRPEIEGQWWQVAGDPDLGEFTSPGQQPVDFAVWQAKDGTWQLWSCIRKTKCGGNTRLFYRWEAKNLTDKNWKPMGIAMQADINLGEQKGGLQAPHVIKVGNVYYMFYGDWIRICLAKSDDGKTFARLLNENKQPDLFSGPYNNTRDAMVLVMDGKYYCYYTGHLVDKNVGADFCRISRDLRNWSKPVMVASGGRAGGTKYSAECPHVVYMPGPKQKAGHSENRQRKGLFYLFRTQRYGKNNVSSVYASPDPLNFGNDDDRYFVGTLDVAAPEIINYEGQYYIAALLPNLKGIRIARLKWVPVEAEDETSRILK